MLVETARRELAQHTRRGLGNVLVYLVVWAILGVLSLVIQDSNQAALMYMIAAIVSWPLNLAISYLLNDRSRLRENPLFELATLAGALQLLFLPIIVGTYLNTPEMMPLYLGILLGAQLLLNTWIYGSLAYLFAGLGVAEVATLSGWLAPTASYVVTPFLVAGVLLVTMFFLLGELSTEKRRGRA